MSVRIIGEPDLGSIAEIAYLPTELIPLETESEVRVVNVRLNSGRVVVLSRVDVELIEAS